MFIFSVKFDKKKAVGIVLAIGIIICSIIVLVGRSHSQSAPAMSSDTEKIKISDKADAKDYLTSLGWEVSEEPVDVQNILIPQEFTEVYEEYNKLQKKQGYDLTEYAGIDAVRYSYLILNYPDADGAVVADIIVSGKKIIGADIQSVKQGGFMHELKSFTDIS